MMQTAQAIHECVAEANISSGNFNGEWDGQVISFFVGPETPVCEIHTNETRTTPTPVMVLVLENLIYVYDKKDLV